LLASLLGLALIPLIGFSVVCLARRRPGIAVILLGAVMAAGAAAIGYAAAEGYGYQPALQRVEFASEAGRFSFDVGMVLLTLGCPAWLLVLVARTQNGTTLGPRGVQWVIVLYGYWMACLVASMVLYSWLTGRVK
jgi:hypothetical protein